MQVPQLSCNHIFQLPIITHDATDGDVGLQTVHRRTNNPRVQERSPMVQPFPYEELTSYLITRNTSERRYFLRPTKELRDAILYCIADAQARHPVAIHAFCAMSNH